MKVVCNYCGEQAVLKDAAVIYRRHGFGEVYQCPTAACDAYVGVHKGSTKPKGTLANGELRQLRKHVHAVFDPLWENNSLVERTEVYEAAAQVMGLKEFHIGELREDGAKDYLSRHEALSEDIQLKIQRNRLDKLSTGSSNLLRVLRYLYVGSQRSVHHVLAQSAYRGHADSFKEAMDAGLVRRIKKAETKKVYFALTPAGCSAICIPIH